MSQDTTAGVKSKTIIDEVQPTEDTLSSRGGLSLVARFLRHGGWLEQIASNFAGLRKSRKGQPVVEVFKQVICFFFDGTRRHLVHRAFKDFGFEQLPFHRFVANAAFYYVMMLSFR